MYSLKYWPQNRLGRMAFSPLQHADFSILILVRSSLRLCLTSRPNPTLLGMKHVADKTVPVWGLQRDGGHDESYKRCRQLPKGRTTHYPLPRLSFHFHLQCICYPSY
jgi:hypothetical protein